MEDWARWVSVIREREKKNEKEKGIKKRSRGKRKRKKRKKNIFLIREEREFNKILLLFFSYCTIAVACILSISGAKNSNIAI